MLCLEEEGRCNNLVLWLARLFAFGAVNLFFFSFSSVVTLAKLEDIGASLTRTREWTSFKTLASTNKMNLWSKTASLFCASQSRLLLRTTLLRHT